MEPKGGAGGAEIEKTDRPRPMGWPVDKCPMSRGPGRMATSGDSSAPRRRGACMHRVVPPPPTSREGRPLQPLGRLSTSVSRTHSAPDARESAERQLERKRSERRGLLCRKRQQAPRGDAHLRVWGRGRSVGRSGVDRWAPLICRCQPCSRLTAGPSVIAALGASPL